MLICVLISFCHFVLPHEPEQLSHHRLKLLAFILYVVVTFMVISQQLHVQ